MDLWKICKLMVQYDAVFHSRFVPLHSSVQTRLLDHFHLSSGQN